MTTPPTLTVPATPAPRTAAGRALLVEITDLALKQTSVWDEEPEPMAGTLTPEATERFVTGILAIEQEAAAGGLDVEIEHMAAKWPDWTFMFGYEVYDPIPGSPGETNHLPLVGKMIWWATARTHDSLGNLVIKAAERQPAIARGGAHGPSCCARRAGAAEVSNSPP